MREKHVGVIDQNPAGMAMPVGVLTDRDIVVCLGDANRELRVGDIMTRQQLIEKLAAPVIRCRKAGPIPIRREVGRFGDDKIK
jgi:hypothetical protein